MPAQADLQVMNLIVQGGSFSVLVLIVVYIGRVIIPGAAKFFENQQLKFDATLERIEQRHERDNLRRDQIADRIADSMLKVVTALGDVTDRLEDLEKLVNIHQPNNNPNNNGGQQIRNHNDSSTQHTPLR